MKYTEQILPGSCKLCGDTRVVEYVDPIIGKRFKSCCCTSYQKSMARVKNSNIPKRFINRGFENYDVSVGGESNSEKNKSTIDKLILTVKKHETVVRNGYDIIISGGVSSGKTMVGCILLKELMLQHGYSGHFLTGEELITLAIAKNKFDNGASSKLDDISEMDFVLIDDFDLLVNLDDARISNNIFCILQNFFSHRKNTNKSFILTSALTFKELLSRDRFISKLSYTAMRFRLYGNYMKNKRGEITKNIGFGE